MALPGLYTALSESARRALGFAHAAALQREPDSVVEPDDLLVGLLLAHPDEAGEARVLLAHFGLTGRDVLSPDYPPLDAHDLRRHTAGISPDDEPPLAPETERALQSLGGTEVQLRDLLGALLVGSSPLTTRLADRLEASGESLTRVVELYRRWLDEPLKMGPSDPPAGQLLRELLERELPRRPVDVPTYAPDRVGTGEDLVGIGREVDAFAYLLASKAQRPPLAVGLFGDWGSGKSFFMDAIRDRIAAIETQIADRPQADVPFWKHVRQIEFNAWEYVRGTLWASLLDHIFRELDGRHIDLVRDRHNQLAAAQGDATQRADAQAAERERLAALVAEQRTAVEEAERAREEGRERLQAERAKQLAERLRTAERAVWGRQAAELAGKDAAELVVALGDARAELLRGRGLLGAYWTAPRVAVATLAALAVPAIALAADALDLPPVVSLLGGLSALVPAVTTLLRSSTRWTRERLNELEAVAREFDEELASLDAQVDEARAELERSEADLAAAETAEQDARAEAAALAGELQDLTPGRVLGEFLQERSRSDDYRRHLGLLARVREDLGNLEQLVRSNNDAGGEPEPGAPPNRIILYIDDLDRCSSEKVVEVLEAVHLLLAFELFVVVVAVDSRWLSFALTDELRALDTTNRGGRRATPQDYLEKIFQLPFWVQPLTAEGRRSLVHGLLEGTVRAGGGDGKDGSRPGQGLEIGPREQELLGAMLSRRGADPRLDAHLLALTSDDLRFMESLSPLLGDTPRRVKRFVNVTQLLLALPPSLESDTRDPPDREIVGFLAALNSGLPALASRLFDAVEPGSMRQLSEVVSSLTGVPDDERDRLTAWLVANPTWSTLPLARLETRLDVVRRLSFQREPALLAHASPGQGG
jgi:KAP family P-loop domain